MAYSSEIAIRKKSIIFVFKCSAVPNDIEGIGAEVAIHGDFVKDVSFEVDNLDCVLETVQKNGLKILEAKREIRNAENGGVLIARIGGSAGSIVHSLVQNIDFQGLFLPGFRPIADFSFTLSNPLSVQIVGIDHVVEAHPEHTLDNVVEWYRRTLRLHRFWSIDDSLVRTEHSALRALLVGNGGTSGSVKMTLVEPATVNKSQNSRKGQIQEFLDLHGSSGVQHIAFITDDIERTVQKLRERGLEFLDIPGSYYDLLENRLARREATNTANTKVDLAKLRQLGILMDFDENGYLLQIFTKPVQDRMTFFLEIIQRHNFNGFGAGNFKALFAAVEMEQKRREQEEGATTEANSVI